MFMEAMQGAGANYNETLAAQPSDEMFSFKGYDKETGKGIYEGNFPKGTPKSAKAEKILYYIQNVWSKKPIPLTIRNEDGTERKIFAEFDPHYDEKDGTQSDASKLMGGNRHGTSSEQSVTLDLADDYYQIASESVYNYSKVETGKSSLPHQDVKIWHYFINDILFQEHGSTQLEPFRVTINVKEKTDGNFVYSFSAERQEKKASTQRTLHAAVTSSTNGESNAQPFITSIDIPSDTVKNEMNSLRNSPEDIHVVRRRLADAFDELATAPHLKKWAEEYREKIAQAQTIDSNLKITNREIQELSKSKDQKDRSKARLLKNEAA